MRCARPSSWAGMHKLATAWRSLSDSTSLRTSPAATADSRSARRAARTRCSKWTNLNGYAGTETVEEGAREAVRVALLGPDGPTGTFSNTAGAIPW